MSAPLHIEVGKSYQTRDGSKATITRSGPKQKSWFGTVDGCPWQWHRHGLIVSTRTHPLDLVAEWVEPTPQPTLKFEAGKAYRTRGGRKVTLTKVMQGDLMGQTGTGACGEYWHPDGRYTHLCEIHSEDLVAEWVEPAPQHLKIEAGKAYRTRDGRKAVIDDVRKSVLDNHPVSGRILATINSSQEERTWTLKGDWSHWRRGSPRDLVAEWVEPAPQPKDLPLEQMRALDIEKTRKELDYTKGLLKQAQERIQALENESDAFAKRIEDLCVSRVPHRGIYAKD